MVSVRTILSPIESARRVRVEQAGGLTDTDVQDALQTIQGEVADIQAELAEIISITTNYRIVTASGDVTVRSSDNTILMNKAVGAPTNINLPTSASRNGIPVRVKDLKQDANTNNITFVPASGETIDGYSATAAAANGVALIDIDNDSKTVYPLASGGWYTLR
jgi:hypothetical protein